MLRRNLRLWQICSDLHIIKNGVPRIKPMAPNLIIAGDIACSGWDQRASDFIRQIAPHFDNIFFAPGNHDLMDSSGMMSVSRDLIKATEGHVPNFNLLEVDRGYVKVGDCAVFGTTLWSHIPRAHWNRYKSKYIDFQRITMTGPGERFDPNRYNILHKMERNYLEDTINKVPKHLIPIIVTHHAPLIEGTCHHQYYHDVGRAVRLNHGYCTDLHPLLTRISDRNPIWVFGHTHYRTHFRFVPDDNQPESGVFLATNALGLDPYIPKKGGPLVPTKTLDSVLDSKS